MKGGASAVLAIKEMRDKTIGTGEQPLKVTLNRSHERLLPENLQTEYREFMGLPKATPKQHTHTHTHNRTSQVGGHMQRPRMAVQPRQHYPPPPQAMVSPYAHPGYTQPHTHTQTSPAQQTQRAYTGVVENTWYTTPQVNTDIHTHQTKPLDHTHTHTHTQYSS
eukprot:GHVR01165538.1.p1 GENE.GHVR01165538.1~~GHVR01165538.1.p1  ORF type:complete len:180 (-),score=95.43 GHVR01165538.1:209-700(-)